MDHKHRHRHKLKPQAEFHGSGATTIGVVCQDGIILAAEKRVSYGYLITSKTGKKVFKITDHIGVACAGLVSDMQALTRDVAANARLFSMDVGRKNQRSCSFKTYVKYTIQ